MDFNSKKDMVINASLRAPVLPDGAQVIDREDWYQVLTPGFRMGADNRVMLSRAKESEVDQKIEETLAAYRKHHLSLSWSVGPMSSPNSLGEKLIKLSSNIVPFKGMLVETKQEIHVSDGISVELVTLKNLEEFFDLTTRAWDMKADLPTLKNKFLKMLQHPLYCHYIAKKGSEAVGSAGIIFKENFGYLIGGVVLKEHRGLGAYRALVQKRLEDLKNKKINLAVTHANSNSSAPILKRLGFETVFEAQSCRFDP